MSVRILIGDMRERLRALEPDSLDSCVTDPPYHLQSIHKRFAAKDRDETSERYAAGPYGRHATGFMGQKWDGGNVAADTGTWAEVYRVLKPGAHLLAFGGTRTYHRMACAIEDAGFEVRDMIQWLYGSGFPKSHNLKGEWDGWGTALKPACEPIVLARKPLSESSIAANVLEHGAGALNIDGCRIFGADDAVERNGEVTQDKRYRNIGGTNFAAKPGRRYTVKRLKPGATLNKTGGNWRPDDGPVYEGEMKPGRWPANVLHDGSEEVLQALPDAPGQQRSVGPEHGRKRSINVFGNYGPRDPFAPRGDTGSAARFFYCAKADRAERGEGNNHPTVKPLDLMQYLCRLVTPRGGTVLDPFAGSGSTAIAAEREGFNAILCELSTDYVEIAERRIKADAGLLADITIDCCGSAA